VAKNYQILFTAILYVKIFCVTRTLREFIKVFYHAFPSGSLLFVIRSRDNKIALLFLFILKKPTTQISLQIQPFHCDRITGNIKTTVDKKALGPMQ
jgi:hypothetical protein